MINDSLTDDKFGFTRFTDQPSTLAWLLNFKTTAVEDEETKQTWSAVEYYFIAQDGETFRVAKKYSPYFYIAVQDGYEREVESWIRSKHNKLMHSIEIVEKEDLDMPNHLSGKRQKYMRLGFRNVQDLMSVRATILPKVQENRKRLLSREAYAFFENDELQTDDFSEYIIDIREYDVKYHVRCAIDNDIRCGSWYTVEWDKEMGEVNLIPSKNYLEPGEPKVMAFDIETTKAPLKFPDPESDHVMMISYMIDGRGYLIVNRQIVSEDIDDFEYTPKPEYEGPFTVFNEDDEEALLWRFIQHMQDERPSIYVTYNGDFFDFPFIDTRAKKFNINLRTELGFWENNSTYMGSYGVHMDAYYWVKRDSYLPQGSQGLKQVTRAKLGYNPLEIAPEDMVRFASEKPQLLASYSVSDAVATYYLYMKYVQPFIFSLCTILPMPPADVLRKGTGTLCEALLMVQAYNGNIICPNKYKQETEKLYKGHLLESETYIGGHVEALEAGVFRSDLPTEFNLVPSGFQQLIDNIDHALKFSIQVEGGFDLDEITNYEEVKEQIVGQLKSLRDVEGSLTSEPLIYHLDVGAMYPNIILTNRLQPCSIVDETTCAACVHNKPQSNCKRNMDWKWRGQYFSANKSDYMRAKRQLMEEKFPPSKEGGKWRSYMELSADEQDSILKKRLSEYSKTAYKKIHEKQEEDRQDTVCMRENPFYVDTVRSFRDRRYEYKRALKVWKAKLDKEIQNDSPAGIEHARKMIILYDSLQLAHKCILNSFYGYVMRRGARWYSMEMAGIVTHTGASIIRMARKLCDCIGKPLELDTDGIWCAFPKSFPENFVFKTTNPKKPKYPISYPCVMLNADVYEKFTNDQFQRWDPETQSYKTSSECTIFFEVDGPYRSMILPASKEEGKGIKKRYAVFNQDGSLAELKGFEIKRRGELKLIKIFQSQVFESFLKGTTLSECYHNVAEVANQYLDILFSQGEGMEDEELYDLITEQTNMSKKLDEYGEQKSAALTTAKRLAEFLGDQMVKDSGLTCVYVVAKKPEGAQVTERVIPHAIFSAEESVKRHFLRKWTREPSLDTDSFRQYIDWNYYITRLGSAIQKIISIPAAFQGVKNPVPRIEHPEWLNKKLQAQQDAAKQRSLSDMWKNTKTKETPPPDESDIENLGDRLANVVSGKPKGPMVHKHKRQDKLSFPTATELSMENSTLQTNSNKTRRSRKRKRDELSDEEETAEEPSTMKQFFATPSKELGAEFFEHQDFKQWLKAKKGKWKSQLRARKRRRINGYEGDLPTELSVGAGMNMSSYLQQRSLLLHNRPWQIVQVREAGGYSPPGTLKFFVLVDDYMHTINVYVPRTFYLNSRLPVDTGDEKVSRILPRSRPCLNLYRKTVQEQQFHQMEKILNTYLTHPDIEGVYERKVEPCFRAITELGCVCKFNKRRKKISSNEEFKIDDLRNENVKTVSYLNDLSKFKKVYCYMNFSLHRGMSAVFLGNTVKVFILNPATAPQTSLDWDRILKEAYEAYTHIQQQLEAESQDESTSQSSSSHQTPPDLSFSVEYVDKKNEVMRRMAKAVETYHSDRRGPTLMIYQGPLNRDELIHQLPTLDEYPVLTLPLHEDDGKLLLKALGWIKDSARRMIQRFLNIENWFHEILEYARYCHVPIGNLENDFTVFMIDVMYARKLKERNHLLWASPTHRPDIGGTESDDNIISCADDLLETSKLSVNSPGSYGNVCVELELTSLDVNTILQSSHIYDIEDTETQLLRTASVADHFIQNNPEANEEDDTNSTDPTSKAPYRRMYKELVMDETTMCRDAFNALKSMISDWYTELGTEMNVTADTLLLHIYRWLRSSHALLYDPALCSMVMKMMKKVFMQLLAEFRRLGSQIVYADFGKIVLATNKSSVNDARDYVHFILNTLKKKDIFSWVEFEPTQFWDHLLWMDTANYGGVCSVLSTDEGEEDPGSQETSSSQDSSISNSTGSRRKIKSQWNVSEYLPQEIRRQFILTVSEFIHQTNKVKFNSKPNHSMKKIITDTFTPRLLNTVPDIDKTVTYAQETLRPGADLSSNNPALEFVKSVCYLFSLEHSVKDEVHTLKKNMLRLLGVREFAKEASFNNPCKTFILPDVICSFCNDCKDLDLLRDLSNDNKTWKCSQCEKVYDKLAIESRLVEFVHKRVIGYQVQDLSCAKCRAIKEGNMNLYHECSGNFRCKESEHDLQDKMKVLKEIANIQEFNWLQEELNWMFGKHL